MIDQFEIWSFRFVNKDTHMKATVYARTEETAMKIITMWNESTDIFHWVKPRFRFKKRMVTNIPPYELEQEQMETIEQWKKHAKSHKDDDIDE